MIKKFTSSLKEIGFLTIALTLALCANFAFGAWSNPPANPPSSNTDAPINVGSSAQAKVGSLGVSQSTIISTAPELEFVETDAQGSRIINSASRLYFQANRGTTAVPSWENSLILFSADSSVGKFAKVYGTMRADEYCDGNGNNCFSGSPAAPVETDPQVGGLNSNAWCRSNSNGTAVICDRPEPLTSYTESDPQVGTLDSGKWCRSNNAGTAIWCGEDVPVKDESDPQVGTIQAGKWCVGNSIGSAVTCSQNAPSPSCSLASRTYRQCGSYPGCGSGEALVESRRSNDDSCTGTGASGDMHYSTCLAVSCS